MLNLDAGHRYAFFTSSDRTTSHLSGTSSLTLEKPLCPPDIPSPSAKLIVIDGSGCRPSAASFMSLKMLTSAALSNSHAPATTWSILIDATTAFTAADVSHPSSRANSFSRALSCSLFNAFSIDTAFTLASRFPAPLCFMPPLLRAL